MTDRKSRTRFRLVPKSTTLDMTLKGHYALCFKTRESFGDHHENWNKDRLHYQRRRCSPMTRSRFWRYEVYTDIRGGSQDLCKFSLDFMPAPVFYVYTYLTLFRYQVQLFCLSQLSVNTAAAGCEVRTSRDVASGS